MIIAAGVSAVPGILLLMMDRLTPPEAYESDLRNYYFNLGKRIYNDEKLQFWENISNDLDDYQQRINNLVQTINTSKEQLKIKTQNLKKELSHPPPHVQYLFNESELADWRIIIEETVDEQIRKEFNREALEIEGKMAVDNLIDKIIQKNETHFSWPAEERMMQLYGEELDHKFIGNEQAIADRLFTLAIRPGRLFNRSAYNRSYIISLYQPDKSLLADKIRHLVRLHNRGIRIVPSSDCYKITILGLEGGFNFGALREASDLIKHYHMHKHDPMIHPRLVEGKS
jgi:hypothetical protein